jgi:outer membrane lipoprotein-sorting protein
MAHKILLLLALFFLSCSLVHGQDFRTAMSALHDRYQNKTSLQISMNVKAFESQDSPTPFYNTDVLIKKESRKFVYAFGTTEMLMNEKYTIMVDHVEKEIVLSRRDPSAEEEFYKQTRFSLDSILTFYEEGQFVGNRDGVDVYSVLQKTGDISKIELSIDRASGSLARLTYLYRTNQFVTIAFDRFTSDINFDESIFNEKNYVKKEGKVWKPATRFVGYRVTDVFRKNAAVK